MLFLFENSPVGTGRHNDVISTSMRRSDIASTLVRRHLDVMCRLGGQKLKLRFSALILMSLDTLDV